MNMCFLTCLALGAVSPQEFRFAGGEVNALTRQLAAEKGGAALALPTPNVRLGRIVIDHPDPADFRRSLDDRLRDHRVSRGHGVSLAPMQWPAYLVQRHLAADFHRSLSKPEPDALGIEDGRVWLSLKDREAIAFTDLRRAAFSKPVEAHWFFDYLHLVGAASATPELHFLEELAFVLGAKLVEEEESYRLTLDPEAFRSRLIEHYRSTNAGLESASYLASRNRLTITGLEELSDDEILQAMQTPTSGIAVVLEDRPRSAKAFNEALSAWLRVPESHPASEREARNRKALFERMNLDGGAALVLSAQDLGIFIRIQGADQARTIYW
jgi:hypothetical protein